MSDLKQTVFRLLEPGDSDDRASRLVDGFIIALILINGVISVLETVPGLYDLHGTFFWAVEMASVFIFTVEWPPIAGRRGSCGHPDHARILPCPPPTSTSRACATRPSAC